MPNIELSPDEVRIIMKALYHYGDDEDNYGDDYGLWPAASALHDRLSEEFAKQLHTGFHYSHDFVPYTSYNLTFNVEG